jgi:hypothetical protein
MKTRAALLELDDLFQIGTTRAKWLALIKKDYL